MKITDVFQQITLFLDLSSIFILILLQESKVFVHRFTQPTKPLDLSKSKETV